MKQSASKQNPDQASGKKSKKGVDQPDTAEEATVDEANIFGGEISESDEVCTYLSTRSNLCYHSSLVLLTYAFVLKRNK